MSKILDFYVTCLPVMLAGIANMIWCKLRFGGFLKSPIDCGKTLRGRRILGDNKTWKGLVGMVVLGALFGLLWGLICARSEVLAVHNYLYYMYKNTIFYNIFMGAACGLAYAAFELPNSFIKRRLGIDSGKPPKGGARVIGIFFDQADSAFGVLLVVAVVYPLDVWIYFIFVLTAAATHIVLNMLLYLLRLRRNPF